MAIHDDNWTREFSIWRARARTVDWITVLNIVFIVGFVTYIVKR